MPGLGTCRAARHYFRARFLKDSKMVSDGTEEVGRIVQFTTRQIEKLARAAGISVDEVRQARRVAAAANERRDFLHILGFVHASKQPEFARLPEGWERYSRTNQVALDLKSVWMADADVMEMVRAGLDQGRTNRLPKSEPRPFTDWLARIKAYREPAPAPAMARI
jgi:hypothetical protein